MRITHSPAFRIVAFNKLSGYSGKDPPFVAEILSFFDDDPFIAAAY